MLFRSMCEHSQAEAVARGYRAMQYNLVVSTNDSAVHLWQKMGFTIVGTIPDAFSHPRHGFVAAHVMYKRLRNDDGCSLYTQKAHNRIQS